MFKCTKQFKKSVKDEKKKIFEEMRSKNNIEEWRQLKEKYDAYDQMDNPNGHISKDTMLAIGGNLAMLAMVLYFEKFDIITSRAFNWIKPRKF